MADLHDDVLVALRRIIRATDLHSRHLCRDTGLTTPQLVVLRAIAAAGAPTVSGIAAAVSLSQATVTSILNRLEKLGAVRRERATEDRRRVNVHLTDAGSALLDQAPRPLQEHFIARFGALPDWEQHQMVASLQRVAAMMDAEGIDAAPLLATGEQVS